jgi:hypothetical protein
LLVHDRADSQRGGGRHLADIGIPARADDPHAMS